MSKIAPLIPSLLRIRHLYRLVISPLTPRDLSKLSACISSVRWKNAAGGDYSSCGYISANHRHYGKTGEKQGKTPIVVRDKAGFYVNRILAPYINEAIRMLTEGERVEHIDAALVKFGFPVGPIQLLDEVGIDTGTKIIPVLEAAYGERFSAPANVVSSILNDDRKGRKNGRGFYLYGQKGRKSKKQVDPAIYPLIGAQGQGRLSAPQVAERCVMLMLNEAVRCVDEQVIRSVRDGDIGAVFGIGFPPFLGGPFRYIDSLGAGEVVAIMQRLATQYGSRFTPCERLVEMGARGGKFLKTTATDLQ